jgi:hypothetical protein
MGFSDLDWLIQTACGHTLDEDGLQAIAIAVDIRKSSDLPIDEICSLWSRLKDHGHGDDKVPADLFNRALNNDFPIPLKDLVAILAAEYGAAKGLPDEESKVEIDRIYGRLDDRLQATLRLSGADFAFLKAALLARGVEIPLLQVVEDPLLNEEEELKPVYNDVVRFFSTSRRFVTLSTMLSLSVQETTSPSRCRSRRRRCPRRRSSCCTSPTRRREGRWISCRSSSA